MQGWGKASDPSKQNMQVPLYDENNGLIRLNKERGFLNAAQAARHTTTGGDVDGENIGYIWNAGNRASDIARSEWGISRAR